MLFFSQKPKTIKDENVGPDSNCKDFKSIFDESFPNEFHKGRIREVFDILQVQQRNDLVIELENVVLQYHKLKVHIFYIWIKKYDFWKHELPLLSEWNKSQWSILYWKSKYFLWMWLSNELFSFSVLLLFRMKLIHK